MLQSCIAVAFFFDLRMHQSVLFPCMQLFIALTFNVLRGITILPVTNSKSVMIPGGCSGIKNLLRNKMRCFFPLSSPPPL